MNTKKEKDAMRIIFTILSVFVAFVYSYTTSPLCSNTFGFDSAIFRYFAKAMNHGMKLYVDLFDNKGPFLFFLESVLDRVGGRYALFVFQCFLIATAFYSYDKMMCKMAAKSTLARITAFILGIFLLALTMDGGNLTEEFCVFPTVICVILYAMKEKNGCVSDKKFWIFSGITFAICILIRPTNAYLVCALMLNVFINSLLKKEWRMIYFLYFFIGALPIIFCICLYFILTGTFYNLVWAGYVFAFKYAVGGKIGYRLSQVIPFACLSLICLWKNRKKIDRIVLFIILDVAAFIYLSLGYNFIHYYQMLIPAWVLLWGYLCEAGEERASYGRIAVCILAITCLANIVQFGKYTARVFCAVVKNNDSYANSSLDVLANQILELDTSGDLYGIEGVSAAMDILERIPENDRNNVFSTSVTWLLITEVFPDYKVYGTVDSFSEMSSVICEEVQRIFDEECPGYVVIPVNQKSMVTQIVESEYELICQNRGYKLYKR